MQPGFKPVTLLISLVTALIPLRAVPAAERPSLVVLIVIDQFPEYLLTRHGGRFGPDGFRRFMDQGAWYTEAHYEQLATLTGVGHATIATGALSAGHGIAGNDWYDAGADRAVYCAEDPSQHWVGAPEKEGEGTGPRNLTAPTFSDSWLIATGLRARAISLSLKDRGSILLGGKLAKSFWFDERTGLFVSSTYYYPGKVLPSWIESFNAAKPADRYFQKSWDLLLPRESYSGAPEGRPYEIDLKGLGHKFPHVIGAGLAKPDADYYKAFATGPGGNQVLLDLARAAVESEKLGQRGTTDILLLSLTSNDYCGHTFGPESIEYEDLTLRTDRQLAAFLSEVDRLVGPGRSLFVLTSDHGAMPTPEYSAELGLRAGRIDPEAIRQAADSALDRAYAPEDWAAKFQNPGLSLRSAPLQARKVDVAAAERLAAEAVARLEGVAAVFTRSDLAAGRIPSTALARSAAATFHPERSPNLIIAQAPYWYLYKDLKKYDGMHGSPYAYDTGVPVMFLGPGIAPGRYVRRVSPRDIAPTIAYLLGMHLPPSSEGQVLGEVVASGLAATQSATVQPTVQPGGGGAPAPHLELFSFPNLQPLLGEKGEQVLVPVSIEAPGGPRCSTARLASALEGGFSGLAALAGADGGLDLWTVTDRGPNLEIEKRVDAKGKVFGAGAKYFPVPGYNQSILRLRFGPEKTVEVVERIGLKREGKPVNGLPSSAPARPSDETAYANPDDASTRSIIPPSPLGYDFEGIHAARSGGGLQFWACEEYGPSVQVFDARGNLLREFAPGVRESGEGTPESPAVFPLPGVLKHRKLNRGFEGLAGTSRYVFALVQSPFDPAGGASGEAGSGNPNSRLHRLVRIDKGSREVTQFAYDHLPDPERYGTVHQEVKTGDLTPLDDSGTSFLVFEYSAKLYSHVYRIAITSETTRLDEGAGVGYEAGRVPYRAVERRLAADLTRELAILPVPAKVEGMAMLDGRTLLLLFDNDYGLGSDGAELFELSSLEKRTLLAKVTLPAGW